MINLGLKRITRLLQHVAQSHLQQPCFNPPWKAVHIAGTNGKGSVAAYLSALLRRQGSREDGAPLRVGRFTSPHFIDKWDCIQINDEPVSKDVFIVAENKVKAIAKIVEEELRNEARKQFSAVPSEDKPTIEQVDEDARLTEFEILTATAFAIFSEPAPVPCDIVVVECGLGGRLDATNALPDSAIAVSVITSIGLDHLGMLGGSLESIVREKCGIVRKDVPVVINQDWGLKATSMVLTAIEARFEHKEIGSNHDVLMALNEMIGHRQLNPEEEDLNKEAALEGKYLNLRSLMPHQLANLSLAFAAFTHAAVATNKQHEATNSLSATLCENVLQDASKSYPARLQLLQSGWIQDTVAAQRLPLLNGTNVLLDGAHNAQSAEVLRKYLDENLLIQPPSSRCSRNQQPKRPEIWIIALSSTKPPPEVLAEFFPQLVSGPDSTLGESERRSSLSNPAKIIFTSFGPVDGMPWVRPASVDTLLQCANRLVHSPDVVEPPTENVVEALEAVEGVLARWKEGGHTKHEQGPLVVIAGSLYLCSDFLRFVRDGSKVFLTHQVGSK